MKTLTRILTLVALVLMAPFAFAANPLGLYNAQYGTEKVIYLSFEDGSTTDNYTGTDFAAGDCKISKDGGAVASTTNVPAQITGSQPHYSLTLTATEMQAAVAYVTCTDASASAWKDVYFRVETTMTLSKLVIDASNGPTGADAFYAKGNGDGDGVNAVGGSSGHGAYFTATARAAVFMEATSGNIAGLSILGSGTGAGLIATGGATGPGISAVGGATSGDGIYAIGTTSGHGISAVGTGSQKDGIRGQATTNGNGINGRGGSTDGYGITAYAVATGYSGFRATGVGAGAGVLSEGGVTGPGAKFLGGSTSGDGILATAGGTQGHGVYAVGYGTNGDGIRGQATNTGNGFNGRGGSTAGYGITAYAVATGYNGLRAEGVGSGSGAAFLGGATGEGLYLAAGGGNNNGVRIEGAGTGAGIRTVGGATGPGVLTVGGSTSGYGIQTSAQTALQGHNLFAVPYIDLTAAPTAGTTSFQEAMGALVGRFYNKVTQTSTTQTIFKADSVTTACTKATTDDGTTQVLARCQ